MKFLKHASFHTLAWMAAAVPAFAQAPARTGTEEIIVTARKAEERLQDVPVAASVLGPEQLETLVLDRFEDYLRQSPSTILVSGGPEFLTDVSIRGQGGGRQGFSESATGVYRNGVFVAGGGFGGRSFNTLDLFDAARVETLRGPQGALFGRNAVGGAINVVSRRPDLGGFSGLGTVGYDDRERLVYRGVLNAPIVEDKIGARIAVTGYDQGDGFYEDVNTGKNVDDQDFAGARVSVTAALNEAWSVTLTAENASSLAPSFSALGRRLDVVGRAERIDPGQFARNASRVGDVEIHESTAFLEVEGSLGFADLTVVSTYRFRDGFRNNDDLDHFLGFEDVNANNVVTDLRVDQGEDFERSGIEVRLASPADSDSALSWLVGADVQRSDSDVLAVNSGAAGISSPLREQRARTETFNEDIQSWSVFGLLEWEASPQWSYTVEGRYQTDDKDFVFARIDREPAAANNPSSSLGPARDAIDDDHFTPGASVRYRLNEDDILYGRVATAFRPGGFNTGTINPGFISYDAETITSGELGWKGNLFGGLNGSIAAYYNESKDVQVVTAISATDTTTALVNVPGATTFGLEIEASTSFKLGPGQLSLQGSAATTDGEFDDGSIIVVQGTTFDLSGSRVNRARDLTAVLNLRYGWTFNDDLNAFTAVTINTESGGFENAVGALKVPGQSRSLDDYAKVDLRFGLNGGRWSASVFARNVGDDAEFLQNVLQNEYYGLPRVIGGEFTVRFGQ